MAKEYIERDQAIRAVCDCRPHSCNFETDCAMGCQDVQALIKIPAADVVTRDCYDRLLAENDELRKERPVRHGRWIIKTIRGEKRTVCSECLSETGTCYEENYCPNCGAKMDKDGDA